MLLDSLATRIRADFERETRRNFYFGILQTVIGYVIGNFMPASWFSQLWSMVHG
jgi:hypothetical protein